MKSADEEADLRALVARVARQVARRTGAARADLAAVVAAEVTSALAAEGASALPPASPPPPAVRDEAKTSTYVAANAPAARAAPDSALRAELCASCVEEQRRKSGRRAVVTTTGKNRKGIVARLAQAIAEAGGDILDISQTLVADYFTMIIIIDTSSLEVPFTELKARLTAMVRGLGAECLVMHEDVVTAMQRI